VIWYWVAGMLATLVLGGVAFGILRAAGMLAEYVLASVGGICVAWSASVAYIVLLFVADPTAMVATLYPLLTPEPPR